MTLEDLIKKIERIKELEASGVVPDWKSYGAAGELARLLNTEILEPEKSDE
jgi:hypothetical protein